jgi:hypothetical protein
MLIRKASHTSANCPESLQTIDCRPDGEVVAFAIMMGKDLPPFQTLGSVRGGAPSNFIRLFQSKDRTF